MSPLTRRYRPENVSSYRRITSSARGGGVVPLKLRPERASMRRTPLLCHFVWLLSSNLQIFSNTKVSRLAVLCVVPGSCIAAPNILGHADFLQIGWCKRQRGSATVKDGVDKLALRPLRRLIPAKRRQWHARMSIVFSESLNGPPSRAKLRG